MNAETENANSVIKKRRLALIQLWPALVAVYLILSTGNCFPLPRPQGRIGDEAVFFWWLNTVMLILLVPYLTACCWWVAALTVRLRREDSMRRTGVRELLDRLRIEGHPISPTLEQYMMERFDTRDLRRVPVHDWVAFLGGMEEIAISARVWPRR